VLLLIKNGFFHANRAAITVSNASNDSAGDKPFLERCLILIFKQHCLKIQVHVKSIEIGIFHSIKKAASEEAAFE
jgi:hypothetical protein